MQILAFLSNSGSANFSHFQEAMKDKIYFLLSCFVCLFLFLNLVCYDY